MRIGLICERKTDLQLRATDPVDVNSELLSESEEDELLSGLRDAGHEVLRIRDARDLLDRIGYWRDTCDLVFNRSAGYRGCERNVLAPAILEVADIPYVGSTPYVHGLVRNKHHTKLVVAAAGVPTPPSAVVHLDREPDLGSVTFPAIVKPLAESSSVGIERGKSVVNSPSAALHRARDLIRRYHQPAIVETFIRGTEVEVPIIADPQPRALGTVAITVGGQIISGDAYLAADTVYGDDYGFEALPSTVDEERIVRVAVTAAAALGLRDYGRIDLRVTDDGTPWFMEADTIPHIQRHSSFFALAKRRNARYHEMLGDFVNVAISRVRRAPGVLSMPKAE